ncbi:MAG: nitroreductase/quinone reductase family protein [Gaiellaceae bacterium]
MAYLKPPLFVRRVFNPIAMRFVIGGSTTLGVVGRRSGVLQQVPVIPIEHDGVRYVVSARGETDWVKNLRAAGTAKLGGEPIRVTEVPVGERPPILETYKAVAGRAVASLFKQLPEPGDHPVFRIERA